MTFTCEHLVQQIRLRVTLLMVEVQDCLPLLLGTAADTSEKGNRALFSLAVSEIQPKEKRSYFSKADFLYLRD